MVGLCWYFLVENVFVLDVLLFIYSYIDCIIVGGVWLVMWLVEVLVLFGVVMGVSYLLVWCEFGVINIGGLGWVEVDG